jgi:hypothetical protein
LDSACPGELEPGPELTLWTKDRSSYDESLEREIVRQFQLELRAIAEESPHDQLVDPDE